MGSTDDQGDRPSTGSETGNASDTAINLEHSKDSTEDQIATMKREIDSLQIELGESNKPWYKQASILIAVLALVFSLGTTYYSNHQTHIQNIHNAKVELRDLIKEIESASLANIDLQNKYKNNLSAANLATSLERTRQIVLVSQAVDIIDSIPDEVSATEYYAVGYALQNISPERVPVYLERGLAKADNVDSYLAISRALGAHYFAIGDYKNGRGSYSRAIEHSNRFPQVSESSVRYYNAYTYMTWAEAELSVSNCLEAKKHHEQSLELYQQLSSEGSNYSLYLAQLEAQKKLIQKKCQ
jgi:tetratricopeptide (TPR) repeat protein